MKEPDNNAIRHTKSAQIVVIDSPFVDHGKPTYPVVIAAVDNAPGSPPDTVLDTVRNGIKVGTPQPIST